MDTDQLITEAISVIVKASPSVTVTGMTILGITLHQWVYVATIIYTIVAIASLIKKHWFDK